MQNKYGFVCNIYVEVDQYMIFIENTWFQNLHEIQKNTAKGPCLAIASLATKFCVYLSLAYDIETNK